MTNYVRLIERPLEKATNYKPRRWMIPVWRLGWNTDLYRSYRGILSGARFQLLLGMTSFELNLPQWLSERLRRIGPPGPQEAAFDSVDDFW